MHIIDFMRKTEDLELDNAEKGVQPVIELPPYHRGHLGFLPETNVYLGIHGEGHRYDKGCELIISAYPSVTANLAELSCTMEDKVGVVNRILRALKSLNVNILVAETYSINHNKRHHMELVFDWSSSALPQPQAVPLAFRSTVKRLHKIVPMDDFRYIRLLGRILQCCASGLIWEANSSSNLSLPRLKLRSFEARSTFAGTGRSQVSRMPSKKKEAEVSSKNRVESKKVKAVDGGHRDRIGIGLSDIESDLKRILDLSGARAESLETDGPLPYLMLSDTATRSLRVWFPQNDKKARQVIHIGFTHSDISGALETITRILRFSNLNILTSLLRRGKQGQNVWEVHLQYGEVDMELLGILNIKGREQRLTSTIEWLCSRIDLREVEKKWRDEIGSESTARIDIRSDLKRFKVRVRAPEYPALKGGKDLGRPFLYTEDGEKGVEAGYFSGNARIEECDEDDAGAAERRKWTTKAIENKRGSLKKVGREWANALAISDGIPVPRVFLSYPSTAKTHASLIKDAIAGLVNRGKEHLPHVRLKVDEFQDPNLRDISGTVLAMIKKADFFLGIWHSDNERDDIVSPWMPYEYGVASALEKPAAVIVRDTIPRTIWGRIDPHIAKPLYNDLSFQADTVKRVIDYINEEWLGQIEEKERRKGVEQLWGKNFPEYD